MTYAFCLLQHRPTAESFGVGAKEESCPQIEVAAIGRSDATHSGDHALGGTSRCGGSRDAFVGHRAADDGRDTAAIDGADGAANHARGVDRGECDEPVMTPPMQVEVVAAVIGGSQPGATMAVPKAPS